MATDRSGWGSRAAKLLTLATLAAVVADVLLLPTRRNQAGTDADASSPDRSGWGSRGPVRILALVALAAVVAGVLLLPGRGDQARAVPGASEDARQAVIEPDDRAGPEPTPVSASADGGRAAGSGPVATDDEEREERRTSGSAVEAAEPSEVAIVAGARLVTEAAPAVFRLTRTGETGRALTVTVGMAESGSMLAGGGREKATFEAGERTTSLSVALADDRVVEETSRVTATIIPGSGYTASAHAGSAELYVADNDRVFLLPDLVADPPVPSGEPEVVWWDGEEMLVLRFEGYVTNLGEGPLDLSGNPQLADPADPTSHDVWQRVRTTTGDWVKLTKPPVRYETDDGHNHFHLMEIVSYSLWDEAGTTQVLRGSKVGFCMLDVESLPERHPNPGEQAYEDSIVDNCRANQPDADSLRMGVTEGWRDVYEPTVTFQWVDVSDLSPGNYRLAAESDPYDIVVETDETNNGVAIADAISVVPGYVAQPLAVETEPGMAVQIVLEAAVFGSPGARVFRIVTPPANGVLDAAAGLTLWGTVLWYTPHEGFSGVDTFEYEAFDWHSAYPRTDPRATAVIGVGVPASTPDQAGSGRVAGPLVAGANTAPVITDPGAQRFTVGDPVDVKVAAADVEGAALTWSADVLPAGVAIVAHTGRIVGNPVVAGSVLSTVTVSDGDLSSQVTISWVIASP